MFGTIRKHQTWLWVFLIALMSISLVFFFSNDTGLLGGRDGQAQGGDYGTFNGRPIGRNEFAAAFREVQIASVIRTQKLPPKDTATDIAIEQQSAARVFAKWLVRKHGIEPSDKAVAQLVQQQLGNFPYDRLEREFFQPNGLTSADYERFVRHEAGILQLMAAAGASAKLISPREADLIYRKEHQETEVQLAVFWATNFQDKVVITNEAIGAFYTNRQFMYRVPERTVLGYVEFTTTNYFAEADKLMAARTNMEEIVNQEYIQRDTNDVRLKDDKGAPLAEAEAKKKIREIIREAFALPAARRAAAEFGTALLEPKAAPGLDPNPHLYGNLEKLAAARGLTVKTTQPFDAISGLEEFEAPTNALPRSEDEFNLRELVRKAALELRDTNAIRFTPIAGPHAVYVIGRKSSVPAETPPLEKISQKVTNDYRTFMAQDLARKTGMAFGTNVTNGIAMKKSFADICKAEGVAIVDVPPFSDTTQSLTNFDARINLRLLQNLARDLEPGKATSFVPFSQEGGLVLYVKGRPKLDDAKVQAAMPEFVNQLRNYRQSEAFNMWFRKQAELARFAPPKREAPQMPGMPPTGPPMRN